MNVKTGVDPELDALTEKTFATTVTKRLKVTPRLVYDLLTKSGFPFELRIEPDAVSWEEGASPTTSARGSTSPKDARRK